MKYMTEAYEALVVKLKNDINDLDNQHTQKRLADNEIISLLLDFIIERHGPQDALEIARKIDGEVGRPDIEGFVRDKIYMLEEEE